MAEGVFPKVDGDILYASEVNNNKRNTAKGILATSQGTFDTTPSNLINVTDEDPTTSTNSFSVAANGGNSTSGIINIDLGSNLYHHKIGFAGSISSSNGNDHFRLEISKDDSSWTEIFNVGTGNRSIGSFFDLGFSDSNFRYIRFVDTRSGAGAHSAQLQEIVVL